MSLRKILPLKPALSRGHLCHGRRPRFVANTHDQLFRGPYEGAALIQPNWPVSVTIVQGMPSDSPPSRAAWWHAEEKTTAPCRIDNVVSRTTRGVCPTLPQIRKDGQRWSTAIQLLPPSFAHSPPPKLAPIQTYHPCPSLPARLPRNRHHSELSGAPQPTADGGVGGCRCCAHHCRRHSPHPCPKRDSCADGHAHSKRHRHPRSGSAPDTASRRWPRQMVAD